MKKIPNESYEQYLSRVRTFEYGRALQALANGEDPTSIMIRMSNRIMQKSLHPIYKVLNEIYTNPIDN